MKPGIYPNISNADYHGGEGVSNSMLSVVREKSPMHLKALRDAANDNEPTAAQSIGTAFHCLVLEPEVFVREYCLGLRQSDVPDAIDDRDVLVAKINELNATRLPKLTTGGSKSEQLERIIAAEKEMAEREPEKHWTISGPAELDSRKGAELKAHIEELNKWRAGLLPVGGNRHELAELLRANGVAITLWSDVLAKWMTNNGHRKVLSNNQWDQLHAMRRAVYAHPAANKMLTGCAYVTEHSAYANDPETGELRRVRPDFWRMDGIVGDLKTTADASPDGFARSIAEWGYDVQHPYYLDTLNLALAQSELDEFATHPMSAKAFVFVVVEKSFPHAVQVYVLDEASEALGRAKYRKSLDTYAECRRTNEWPGYSDGSVQTISLPQWHLNQNSHLIGAA